MPLVRTGIAALAVVLALSMPAAFAQGFVQSDRLSHQDIDPDTGSAYFGARLALDYGAATTPTNLAPRALYTVGPHANCDFSQLQPAIDAAASGDTIRVARSNAYLGRTYDIWGKSLTIEGGVDTCNLSETPMGINRDPCDLNRAQYGIARRGVGRAQPGQQCQKHGNENQEG